MHRVRFVEDYMDQPHLHAEPSGNLDHPEADSDGSRRAPWYRRNKGWFGGLLSDGVESS
jgi:hypothetical protein